MHANSCNYTDEKKKRKKNHTVKWVVPVDWL